jgi:hypothetical protein
MSATPPPVGPYMELSFDSASDTAADFRVQPETMRTLSQIAAHDSLRDPVNFVRRLQRSLQLRERHPEAQQASSPEEALAQRFFQPDGDERSQ